MNLATTFQRQTSERHFPLRRAYLLAVLFWTLLLAASLSGWQISKGRFFTGVIRDISTRKGMENELDRHREHLEEIWTSRCR
ncbi:MAG: hypothetical protein Q8O37_11840 [Sulfuricellaceae bacterium]|nr:hypothetical protein [Sulfuricellaceae bacterium]